MKIKNSVIWTKFSAALRRSAICAIALGAVLQGATALAQVQNQGVQITGNLGNFDVRYPASLPNDLEVVIYGDFPTSATGAPLCVIGTWNTNNLLGGRGVQWGPAQQPIVQTVDTNPTSPTFGLDCITIRWAGPARPAMVGQMVHFGVHLRPGCVVQHQEVWWTINGQRVHRPCDPHITWFCTTRGWTICIGNPTPFPIYVYGCRHFTPIAAAPLPTLNQMNLGMNPAQFGATGWTPIQLPGGRVTCIPPWCRIYVRVFVPTWRPIIFQIAARNVPETPAQPGDPFLPLPPGTNGPNPDDIDPSGEVGTMFILTTRATEEQREDVNGDGAVGLPDFNMLRSRFGTQSQDLNFGPQ